MSLSEMCFTIKILLLLLPILLCQADTDVYDESFMADWVEHEEMYPIGPELGYVNRYGYYGTDSIETCRLAIQAGGPRHANEPMLGVTLLNERRVRSDRVRNPSKQPGQARIVDGVLVRDTEPPPV